VSVSTNPTIAIGPGTPYFDPVISADGRFVAYVAEGARHGLGALGTYWRDVTSPSAVWLGQNAGVIPFQISMSGNGRYVACSLYDENALCRKCAANSRYSNWNRYLHNAWISSLPWTSAAISPDGSRLLLVMSNTLYLYDLAGKTNLLSIPGAAQLHNASGWSADSRYLAFVSSANLLTSGDDGTNKVYLCDLQTGTITLVGVSGPNTGSMAALSDSPAISADGRFVAYRSAVTNYVAGDAHMPPNIFLYDRLSLRPPS